MSVQGTNTCESNDFMLQVNVDSMCSDNCSLGEKLKTRKGKFSMLNGHIVVVWR